MLNEERRTIPLSLLPTSLRIELVVERTKPNLDSFWGSMAPSLLRWVVWKRRNISLFSAHPPRPVCRVLLLREIVSSLLLRVFRPSFALCCCFDRSMDIVSRFGLTLPRYRLVCCCSGREKDLFSFASFPSVYVVFSRDEVSSSPSFRPLLHLQFDCGSEREVATLVPPPPHSCDEKGGIGAPLSFARPLLQISMFRDEYPLSSSPILPVC